MIFRTGRLMLLRELLTILIVGTSAVGRYQFIGPTLENLKNRLGYKDTDVFSPEVQDRLFDALMEEQGLQELSAGLITPERISGKAIFSVC
jgi:muramidase (phage lysozyme)